MRRTRLIPLVGLLLLAGLGASAALGADTATERWYETIRNRQKFGHSRVVWAPSTWEKRPTVHDTTTIVRRSVRNMAGMRDEFETITTIDIERGDDGTLWWMKTVTAESGRTSSTEVTWTGEGYEHTSRMEDREQTIVIPLENPVAIDLEAFLGPRIRGGTLKVGDTFDLPQLDVAARGARVYKLEVLARESIVDGGAGVDEDGNPIRVPCFKVRETDPRSGSTLLLWLDDDGSYVKLVAEGGLIQRRVTKESAESWPLKPAEFTVTTPSTPVLERIMSADTLYLDLHVQGDPDRTLPEFPESPWSRVVEVEGNEEDGWVFKMRLDKYDDLEATTELPLAEDVREKLERHLEPNVLMPCTAEVVVDKAKEIVGEETDARKAAWLLARWVFENLRKQSPNVAQASATEILESGRGDCSEHALLFVTLCRAAGIPARQCSGYVNIGSMWGAHAWAEIWLGRWVGADPTTGEIGQGARYVFFGYHDDPDSSPGLVTSRARGRMRFVATRIVEGADDFDLTDPERWTIHDREQGRYVHVLAGIEARDVPRDWVVRLTGSTRAVVRADGFQADIRLGADQGWRINPEHASGEFAGAPAQVMEARGRVIVRAHSRRRLVIVRLSGEKAAEMQETFEKVFAPTFAPVPTPYVPKPVEEEPSDDAEQEDEPEEK